MLIRAEHLRGYGIDAVDGAIGRVDDLLFDERSWMIRYVVADVGGWLSSRRMLLSVALIRRSERESDGLQSDLPRDSRASVQSTLLRNRDGMTLQHPNPPEPPVRVPPQKEVPDPTDPTRRNPERRLPPDKTPVPTREPGQLQREPLRSRPGERP